MLFPKSKPARALIYVSEYHDMVLCDRNLYELREVLERKAPNALPDAEVLINELSYELIPAAYNARNLIKDKNNSTLGFKPKCCFVCAVLKNTQIII